jgi:PAS domain-containing protein
MSFPGSKKIKIPGFNNTAVFTEWERLLDIIPEGVFLLNSHLSRIRYANSSFVNFTGYPFTKLIDMDVSILLPECKSIKLKPTKQAKW